MGTYDIAGQVQLRLAGVLPGRIPPRTQLRVNSYKNVTEGRLLTHLEMLPEECHLLSFSCIGGVRVLPQPVQRLIDFLS